MSTDSNGDSAPLEPVDAEMAEILSQKKKADMEAAAEEAEKEDVLVAKDDVKEYLHLCEEVDAELGLKQEERSSVGHPIVSDEEQARGANVKLVLSLDKKKYNASHTKQIFPSNLISTHLSKTSMGKSMSLSSLSLIFCASRPMLLPWKWYPRVLSRTLSSCVSRLS